MRALVLSIAWVFACSFCTAVEVPVQPDFDAQKFGGKWYTVQIVMDKGLMKPIRIVGGTAVPKDNGDIDMNVEAFDKGECNTKKTTFMHTDQPGKFVTKVGNIIHVVETDYESYHILYVKTKVNQVLYLEGRNHEVPDNIKEKFKTLASSLGIPEKKIINLPKTDSCA